MLARDRMLDVAWRVRVLPRGSGVRSSRLNEGSELDLRHLVVAERPVLQHKFLVRVPGQVGLVIAVVEQLDVAVLEEDELLPDYATPVSVEVSLMPGSIRMRRGDEADGREVRPLTERALRTLESSLHTTRRCR